MIFYKVEQSILILLDLSAACDTVEHRIMIDRLQHWVSSKPCVACSVSDVHFAERVLNSLLLLYNYIFITLQL